MRVRYKLFPYPVLCSEIDDYKENRFEVVFDVIKDIHQIRFQFQAILEDNLLKEMLEQSQVELVYHIECAKTLYRQIHCTKYLQYEVAIDEKQLNGKVDICCFIVATEDIASYCNDNFNEDYKGVSFEILKGNILGFYNLPRMDFTKNTEELSKVSSIFSVIRKEAAEEGMEIELTGDKIKICLGNDAFMQYKNFAKASDYQSMMHAILIFPSLLYALDMIMKDGEEDYQEYRWFKAIDKMLSASNKSLNKETIEQMTSYKLAQKLLNLPVNRALSNMRHEGDELE